MKPPASGPTPQARPARPAQTAQTAPAAAGGSGGLDAEQVRHRLGLARELTQGADAMAGHLLSVVGLLLTAGSVVATTTHLHGPALIAASLAAVGLGVALLALLDVLRIRGGHAGTWLATAAPLSVELAKVARIVTAKHRALQIALRALQAALVAAAAAGLLTLWT